MTELQQMKQHAREIFKAGVSAAVPAAVIRKMCRVETSVLYAGSSRYDLDRIRRIFVVGAGKATAVMAQAVEEILGARISDGLISVKYGHTAPLEKIRIIEAGHPVPDINGRRAAGEILEMVRAAGEHDLVICLLSGGGSALLPLPAPGISLEDKQQVTDLLLGCGADIHEMNTVRKHLSAIKGGHLAWAASPAQVLCLILSDVVGDDPGVIASGPCSPDETTLADAWGVIRQHQLEDQIPGTVVAFFRSALQKEVPETPKPGQDGFDEVKTHIVGSNRQALDACAEKAHDLGYQPLILSAFVEGETHTIARFHAAVARQVLQCGQPASPPVCILSGGESTLVVKGEGKGGRNQEAALAAALYLKGLEHVAALCAGTDGTDGPTDAAGALADGRTVSRAESLGLDASDFLDRNDAYSFFKALDDLVVTGPTGTNVMDLNIFLVGGASPAGREKETT